MHIFEKHFNHTHFLEEILPSFTPDSLHLISLINCLKGHKSLRTLGADPETLTEWKSESVTYGHLTWVGTRVVIASSIKYIADFTQFLFYHNLS